LTLLQQKVRRAISQFPEDKKTPWLECHRLFRRLVRYVVNRKHSLNQNTILKDNTVVIERTKELCSDEEIEHPHCKIPPHFFERALARASQFSPSAQSVTARSGVTGGRDIFSITTWDGRMIFSIEGEKS
jgi:hypothetical protein